MNKLLIVSLMFVIATVSYFFWESSLPTKALDNEVTYKCILKPISGQWVILDNATHANSGCISVSQTSTYLQVSYPAISEVTGNVTQVDDALAKANINAGSSVGLSYSNIYFSRGINPNTITNNGAAIFFEVSGI